MKILHICKVYRPVKGGVQIVVERIINYLPKQDYNFTVLTTAAKSSSNIEDNAVIKRKSSFFEWRSLPISPSLILSIFKEIRNQDIVVVHYPFPLADLTIALYPGKIKALIVYWHSDIVEQKRLARLVQPFTASLLKKATKIIIASPKLLEHSQILKKYSVKCYCIPFGYKKDNSILPKDDNYYLCIARHVKYKGIDNLIQAVADFPVKTIIVGSGPLLEEHQALTAKLNLKNMVEFVTGINDQDLTQLIANCRALILPSVTPNEAFGLVQIEAMAYGKPIINTNLKSSVPWVARNNLEGLTTQPGDVSGLIEAIKKIDTDIELRNHLGANSLKRWQTLFSAQRFADVTDTMLVNLHQDANQS